MTPLVERYTPTTAGIFVPRAMLAPRTKPIAVDLFAGAGGFSCGFTQGGFHVAAACEHDYWAMSTYLLNLGGPETKVVALDTEASATMDKAIAKGWKGKHDLTEGLPFIRCPDGTYRMPGAGSAWRRSEPGVAPAEVYYFGDVHALTGAQVCADLGLQRGDVDVIIGGPPCQGFSAAGKRDVMDPRNSLVFEFARLIVEISPKTFVMENVVGLASMVTPEGLGVIDAFCMALSKGGYSTVEALKRSMGVTPTGRAAARAGGVVHGKDESEPAEEEPEALPTQGSLF